MGVYTFPTSLRYTLNDCTFCLQRLVLKSVIFVLRRWDHPATFAMLFLWFTIIALAYMYRIKSVVYDELTDAELVGDRLEVSN